MFSKLSQLYNHAKAPLAVAVFGEKLSVLKRLKSIVVLTKLGGNTSHSIFIIFGNEI